MGRSLCRCGRPAKGGRGLCRSHRREADEADRLPPRINLELREVKRLMAERFGDQEFTVEQLADVLDVTKTAAALWMRKLLERQAITVRVGWRGRYHARRAA
jgi:hypothetical protein